MVDINGAECTTPERFFEACEAASILATLQAGYTDFRYLSKEAKEIFDREALIGVSVTGWMNNPDVLLHDGDVMASGAHIVKKTNKEVADLIGINPAARTTCVKPAGNSSVLLGTASGIHPEHAPAYFRNVQMSKGGAVEELIKKTNPQMVEDSKWSSSGNDSIIAFPIESPEGSMFKDDMQGVKHLRWVEKVQKIWVEEGTNRHLCTDSRLRHNVSNTIVVDDWDAVGDYIYNNQKWFAGVSLIPDTGDKDFPQAPFTAVHDPQDLVLKYGDAAMFASGLIVEGEEAFGDLWSACSTALGYGEELGELSHSNLTKHDFMRRVGKFADNYFAGDMLTATYCLKDVYNLHKWSKIKRNLTDINWNQELTQQEYTDADTLGAAACSGGACEI